MIRFVTTILILVSLSFAAKDGDFNMQKLNAEVKNPLAYDSAYTTGGDEMSPLFVVFRIIGSLVILSAIIITIVWWLRKSGVGNNKLPEGFEPAFETLQELPISSTTSLLLVRFQNEVLLLSQTQNRIEVIKNIIGDEAKKLIAESAGGKSIGTFRANLNRYVMDIQKGNKSE
jgi:flagellar biogenesis protein FliO